MLQNIHIYPWTSEPIEMCPPQLQLLLSSARISDFNEGLSKAVFLCTHEYHPWWPNSLSCQKKKKLITLPACQQGKFKCEPMQIRPSWLQVPQRIMCLIKRRGKKTTHICNSYVSYILRAPQHANHNCNLQKHKTCHLKDLQISHSAERKTNKEF